MLQKFSVEDKTDHRRSLAFYLLFCPAAVTSSTTGSNMTHFYFVNFVIIYFRANALQILGLNMLERKKNCTGFYIYVSKCIESVLTSNVLSSFYPEHGSSLILSTNERTVSSALSINSSSRLIGPVQIVICLYQTFASFLP